MQLSVRSADVVVLQLSQLSRLSQLFVCWDSASVDCGADDADVADVDAMLMLIMSHVAFQPSMGLCQYECSAETTLCRSTTRRDMVTLFLQSSL
mmetsp:Transcript_4077/g.10725  ORF Transcript_4077/g.10725 Transcript_4077/m.10725 type:complete len:94 (+) Transcript_4077:764-1045(+)